MKILSIFLAYSIVIAPGCKQRVGSGVKSEPSQEKLNSEEVYKALESSDLLEEQYEIFSQIRHNADKYYIYVVNDDARLEAIPAEELKNFNVLSAIRNFEDKSYSRIYLQPKVVAPRVILGVDRTYNPRNNSFKITLAEIDARKLYVENQPFDITRFETSQIEAKGVNRVALSINLSNPNKEQLKEKFEKDARKFRSFIYQIHEKFGDSFGLPRKGNGFQLTAVLAAAISGMMIVVFASATMAFTESIGFRKAVSENFEWLVKGHGKRWFAVFIILVVVAVAGFIIGNTIANAKVKRQLRPENLFR